MNIDGVQLYTKANSVTGSTQLLTLSLDIADLTQSFILQAAYGLDLEDVIPLASGENPTANTNEPYYDITIPARTLTFRLRLNPQPGETNGGLRDKLYKVTVTVGWTDPNTESVRLVTYIAVE